MAGKKEAAPQVQRDILTTVKNATSDGWFGYYRVEPRSVKATGKDCLTTRSTVSYSQRVTISMSLQISPYIAHSAYTYFGSHLWETEQMKCDHFRYIFCYSGYAVDN